MYFSGIVRQQPYHTFCRLIPSMFVGEKYVFNECLRNTPKGALRKLPKVHKHFQLIYTSTCDGLVGMIWIQYICYLDKKFTLILLSLSTVDICIIYSADDKIQQTAILLPRYKDEVNSLPKVELVIFPWAVGNLIITVPSALQCEQWMQMAYFKLLTLFSSITHMV